MLPNFKRSDTEPPKISPSLTGAMAGVAPAAGSSARPLGVARGSERNAPSVIGPDLMINGNLVTKGEVQIDGEVQGDIQGTYVVIGEKARITGGITAEEIVVRGHVMARCAASASCCSPPATSRATSSTRRWPSSRAPSSRASRAARTIRWPRRRGRIFPLSTATAPEPRRRKSDANSAPGLAEPGAFCSPQAAARASSQRPRLTRWPPSASKARSRQVSTST